MKGLIKLTPESLISLIADCSDYIDDFDIGKYGKKELKWSWCKFKKIEWTVYSGLPFWYQYKSALKKHLYDLFKIYDQAKKYGDEIWLSQLSYTHMCLLKDGNHEANPTFIMNY